MPREHPTLRSENLSLKASGRKRCGRCLEIKLVDDEFSKRKSAKGVHKVDEVLTYCKLCAAEIRKKTAGPEAHWYRTYNLSPERARQMKAEQNNLCAVCQKPPVAIKDTRMWCVDHDHKCCAGGSSCGKCIRGLTCYFCNVMLGMAKDNSVTLERAAKYLQRFW